MNSATKAVKMTPPMPENIYRLFLRTYRITRSMGMKPNMVIMLTELRHIQRIRRQEPRRLNKITQERLAWANRSKGASRHAVAATRALEASLAQP
jgi:hypothetical protein